MFSGKNLVPRIGIFWIYQGVVLGQAVDLAVGEEGVPGLLDSPDNHADLWEGKRLLTSYPELRGREYFAVPRGRVLWNFPQKQAIVYMDAKLFDAATKASIAVFFDLTTSEIVWRTDPHYTTGN